MKTLTQGEAIKAGQALYARWCSGDGKVDLLRVQRVIREEIAETKKKTSGPYVRRLSSRMPE